MGTELKKPRKSKLKAVPRKPKAAPPNGLKRLRERAGMTQDQGAAAMGMSKSGLVKIERGERRLSDVHIRAAKRAYSASERDVLDASESVGPAAVSQDIELTAAEYEAVGRGAVMTMQYKSDPEGALLVIEELIERARRRGASKELLDMEALRAEVRLLIDLSRAGRLRKRPDRT